MMLHWVSAFALTELVEVPIYLVALRASRRSSLARFAIAFGASLITHPLVWFVIPELFATLAYRTRVLIAEGFAIAVEAAYLAAFRQRFALRWSITANAASFALGLVCRSTLGWP
jgi:hypothetical protein